MLTIESWTVISSTGLEPSSRPNVHVSSQRSSRFPQQTMLGSSTLPMAGSPTISRRIAVLLHQAAAGSLHPQKLGNAVHLSAVFILLSKPVAFVNE